MSEDNLHPHPTRVALVGTGNVGATFAYALAQSGLASEIVLIDVNRTRAEGEAMDLNHAVPFFSPCRIWAGDYADCTGAAVTVITAGAAQKPGETRHDLVKKNTGIFADAVDHLVDYVLMRKEVFDDGLAKEGVGIYEG